MNIAEICIQRKTTTLVFTVAVVIAGCYAYQNLGRLEDPEFTIKEAQIITQYPGAAALEVAEEVTDPLETAVQQMAQLKKVTSISRPGLSIIRAEMKDHYDKTTLPQVWDELRRKVGDVQDRLPPGCSKPLVNDDFGDVYGVFFCLYGDGFSYAELLEYAKLLRRELLLIKDVAKISLYGEQQEAVYLEIPRERLAQLGIPPELIRQTLVLQNQVAPAGRVEIDSRHVVIRPTGELHSVEDLGNLLILQGDGARSKLYLRDVAVIERDYVEPYTRIMRYNGKRAVGLGVSTAKGGNVVKMGEALTARIEELMSQIPIGVELGVVSVQGETVTRSIKDFIVSLVEAVAIVIAVLLITMGFRSGMIIGAILLLVILATFTVMYQQNVLLERVSLGALIIALGMLVDNAIVIVEGILVGMQRGRNPAEAATAVVKQTMWPLLAATIVAVLAFAPIGASQDKTGEYCRSLFLVLLFSLLLSWVLALTVTPLLGVMFLKAAPASGTPDEQEDPYNKGFFRIYRGFLEHCLRARHAVLLVVIGALAAAVYGFGFVSKSFFPPSTRPQFMVHCWMPQGTHILRTEQQAAKLETFLLKQEGVTDVSSYVGAGALRLLLTYQPEEPNSAYAMLIVSVDDYRKARNVMDAVREFAARELPDALVYSRNFVLGPGEPQKIQFRLRGSDPEILRRLAEETKSILYASPLITDIVDDWRERVTVIRPTVAEAAARNVGLTRAQIAAALQQAFEGVVIGQYREKDLLLPIIARAPIAERGDATNLSTVQVWSPVAGRSVPLGQLIAGLATESENDIMRRRNRLPTITVKCDPAAGEADPAFNAVRPQVEDRFEKLRKELGLADYTLEFGGEYENSRDAQAGLKSMIAPIFVAMFLILIGLFNSVRQPLVIFLTVPFAVIGVTVGLLAFNQPFGFMALLGFLSLSGMIIKNAVVLVDEINMNLSLDKTPYDSVVEAGVSRLRPVMNAALTTLLGVAPLLMDPFYAAMAVAIMMGLAFATALTLVVVPVLYSLVFGIAVPGRAEAARSAQD